MATGKTPHTTTHPQCEPHMMFEVPYNCVLVIPVRFAAEVLATAAVIRKEYNSQLQHHEYFITPNTVDTKILTAEQIEAMHVKARLTGETPA